MRLILFLLAFLSLTPAHAEIAADALRDLIIADDRPAVARALAEAVAEDASNPRTEPERQRALFTVFSETHPRNDRFTAAWLAAAPDDPLALTARAWHLAGLGWAQRGSDAANATPPEARAAMRALHQQAFLLFDAAATAAPRLLAASDGRLVLVATVAPDSLIPTELERIMRLYPNRGTLMRAMHAVSPQWGGAPHQMPLLCDRYAPMVHSVPGYDSAVCQVDAVFYAGVQSRAVRARAVQALAHLPHPILDHARRAAALASEGDPGARIATLNALAATRTLTAAEALALDQALGEISGSFGLDTYIPALAASLKSLREEADRDPLSADPVIRFIEQAEANDAENGIPFDQADGIRRVQVLLRATPHNWRAWLALAELTAERRQPDDLEISGRYFNNALHLSGHLPDVLRVWLSSLSIYVLDLRIKSQGDGSAGLSADALAERDRTLNCPLVALTRLHVYVCKAEGGQPDDCRQSISSSSYVFAQIDDTLARGACQAEVAATFDRLLGPPTPVDF